MFWKIVYMSLGRWEERVQDFLDAISEIRAFVEMMEFKDFQSDIKTMRAVELDFIVIGEAANNAPLVIKAGRKKLVAFWVNQARSLTEANTSGGMIVPAVLFCPDKMVRSSCQSSLILL
jgi:hypothetical protein